jgi:hypothetical protein
MATHSRADRRKVPNGFSENLTAPFFEASSTSRTLYGALFLSPDSLAAEEGRASPKSFILLLSCNRCCFRPRAFPT